MDDIFWVASISGVGVPGSPFSITVLASSVVGSDLSRVILISSEVFAGDRFVLYFQSLNIFGNYKTPRSVYITMIHQDLVMLTSSSCPALLAQPLWRLWGIIYPMESEHLKH